AAVQIGQNATQVFVVKADKTLDIRSVKILRATGDFTLIAEGVRAGETVVTDGHLRLTPSARVEVRTLAAAAAGPAPKAAK
ncbi:MAG: efflux RND transporter periplasmic adaptor subunit, partial [Opitutaceae bacterium]